MRTLPLRLSPIEGESLPGYVARYAHTFQFPPGDVIRALGLDGGGGTIVSAGRYGVSLTTRQLKDAAFASGIATETVERMLLSRYAGRAFARSTLREPFALAGAAQAHEVFIWCPRFCPQCLREDGGWRLRWQLAWSVLCPRHRVLLVRSCPNCGRVPEIGSRARWSRDKHGTLTDPARCWRRRQRQLCRGRLGAAEAVSVDQDPAMLAAQRRIDELLEHDVRPILAGEELDQLTYLRDLRALCNLLHGHFLPVGRSRPPLRGQRLLDDPAAVAKVLAEALKLADLPDQETLAAALRELADRRYRTDGQTLIVSKLGQLSHQLRAALRRAASETMWAPASSRMGFHPRAHRRPDDLDHRLDARHVPQLFWAADYEREIAELFDFDDFTHWLGRRFCSVLLARMLTPLDWHAAVRYLDFPETGRFFNDGYNTTFTKLRANNRFDELAKRVKQIANQHAQEKLIDYKQRRAHLAGWTGIDLQTWALLQPHPRSDRWRADTPSRRARAGIWLWCHLTSGHERAAPIALPTGNLAHQSEFIREALPALQERLDILGEILLATPSSERHTLPAQLETALHRRPKPARPVPGSNYLSNGKVR